MSPRNSNQANGIARMNVMNFVKPHGKKDRSEREEKSNDSRFLAPLDRDNQDYHKAVNRQGSKKMIQGTHLMNQHMTSNQGFN